MSLDQPVEHRNRDLDNDAEVAEFVDRFYQMVGQDQLLMPYFDVVAKVDWETHRAKLTDFWSGILFMRPHDHAAIVIEAHRHLHDSDQFDREKFERWLAVLDSTLDGGWTGPRTEQIRRRGHGFAWAMAHRLLGISLPRPTGYNPEHRGRDIDTRAEVAEFVERMYRDISQDDLLHHHFETIAKVNWQAHMLMVTDFWSGILFDEEHDDANTVIEAHRGLHDTSAFTVAMFERWLEIFDTSLDGGWIGPNTEQIRKRGYGLAWAMAHRLLGVSIRSPATEPGL